MTARQIGDVGTEIGERRSRQPTAGQYLLLREQCTMEIYVWNDDFLTASKLVGTEEAKMLIADINSISITDEVFTVIFPSSCLATYRIFLLNLCNYDDGRMCGYGGHCM